MTQYIYYNPQFHVWQVTRHPFESCELNEIPTVVSGLTPPRCCFMYVLHGRPCIPGTIVPARNANGEQYCQKHASCPTDCEEYMKWG